MAMTNQSLELVRSVWAAAADWTGPWPENDDTVNAMSHGINLGLKTDMSRREGMDACAISDSCLHRRPG